MKKLITMIIVLAMSLSVMSASAQGTTQPAGNLITFDFPKPQLDLGVTTANDLMQEVVFITAKRVATGVHEITDDEDFTSFAAEYISSMVLADGTSISYPFDQAESTALLDAYNNAEIDEVYMTLTLDSAQLGEILEIEQTNTTTGFTYTYRIKEGIDENNDFLFNLNFHMNDYGYFYHPIKFGEPPVNNSY